MIATRKMVPSLMILPFVLLLWALLIVAARPQLAPVSPAADALTLPLAFVANDEPGETAVRAQAHLPGGVLTFSPAEVTLSVPQHGQNVRLHFAGANPTPEIALSQQLPGVVNYIIGDDPAQWKTQLPTYGGLVYQQLYDGIDLHYEGDSQALKGTYHVAAGVDTAVIRWSYDGVSSVRLDPRSGDLMLTLPGEANVEPVTLVEEAPIAWQVINGQHIPVEIRYTLNESANAATSLGFALGAYDPAYALIIDPSLVYSALIGGGGFEEGRDIAVDSSGNVYLTGTTLSTSFPNAGAPQNSYGGSTSSNFGDAFIAKLNPAGTALLYMTYLGGSGADIGDAITVDSQGNAYVTGMTESNNFPTTASAYQQNRVTQTCSTAPCADAFVTKLNAAGNALVFSSYLGGGGEENSGLLDVGTRQNTTGIALDGSLNVYVTGVTFSTNFPTQNQAFGDGDGAFSDIFLAKLSTNGQTLLYSSYLGGDGAEHGGGVAVNTAGVATLTGATLANNFPTKNALQGSLSAAADAVVAQFDTTKSGSSSLVFSTYLGGDGSDYGFGIAQDSSGIYVAGHTTSLNLPAPNGYQTTNASAGDPNPRDTFLVKLNPAGSARLYGTYLGGSSSDVAYGLDLDAQGNVYLTGTTSSNNFPARESFESWTDFRDVFVAKINPAQSGSASLVYSTLFGSPLNDYSYGIAVDGQGNAYITGYGSGAADDEFPIHTTIGVNGSGNGVLVAKFGPTALPYAVFLPLIIADEEPVVIE
ncbi:MAG: SBBP repeat-containing protein [Anaerolineaceae bacterium]|nr:SBBP repeat-containing protein [Anaerolineaceae bacterium]